MSFIRTDPQPPLPSSFGIDRQKKRVPHSIKIRENRTGEQRPASRHIRRSYFQFHEMLSLSLLPLLLARFFSVSKNPKLRKSLNESQLASHPTGQPLQFLPRLTFLPLPSPMFNFSPQKRNKIQKRYVIYMSTHPLKGSKGRRCDDEDDQILSFPNFSRNFFLPPSPPQKCIPYCPFTRH